MIFTIIITVLFNVLFYYIYINTYYNSIDFKKMKVIKLSQGEYRLIYKNTYVFERCFSIVMDSKYKNYEYIYESTIESDIEKLKNGSYKLKRSGELVEVQNKVNLGNVEDFIENINKKERENNEKYKEV
ncbi:MAG: hypothetical protein WCQ76_05985 [Fusobacterium sp.]